MNDLKFAFRQFAKNPGFTIVAVLTLALGIGANTAIFSVVNAVLLQPLPYPDANQLVWLSESNPSFPSMSIAWPNFVDWRAQQTVFEKIGVYNWCSYNLTGDGPPLRVAGSRISASALAALQVRPALGRLFREDEDKPGAPPVLLLSDKFWRAQLGGDPDIVNRALKLDGRQWTVLGVMPAGFAFPDPVDIWVPVGPASSDPSYQDRDNHPGLLGIARLKSGVSLEQARAGMENIAVRLEQQYPASNRNIRLRIDPLLENRVGSSVRAALWTILGAVGMVLLIACGNIANLLLARAAARQKEMAVRAALGAGRWRIARQLLTESWLLSVLGGLLGLGLAQGGLKLILALSRDVLPRADEIRLAPAVLAFNAAICFLTGILFGLAPAWQASRPRAATLKETARGITHGPTRLREALVIGEVALTVLLLISAGLLLRTFQELQRVDPGFSHERVLSFRLDLPRQKYENVDRQIQFYQALVEKLGSVPGVQHVGVAYQFPLAPEGWQTTFDIEGQPAPPQGQRPSMEVTPVSPDYFRTMGIHLLRGRFFSEADNREHLRNRDLSGLDEIARRNAGMNVIIVDEEFVRRHWPHEDPLGKRVRLNGEQPLTVVGVVARVKMSELAEQGGFVQAYVPMWQYGGAGRAVLVKTTLPPERLVEAVLRQVRALDPDQPIYDLRTLATVRHDSLAPQRLNLALLALFAGLALTLAVIGLYGVLAYTVVQRTRELGIRLALGAGRGEVMALVLRHGLNLTLVGMALGLGGAVCMTRLLARLLYQVKPLDPWTFAAVPLVLGAAALAACWLPAWRAARADPMMALRYE